MKIAGQQLLAYIERIESVRAEKKQLSDDEKSIFAEAKAAGFNPKRIRNVLKRRSVKQADLEEAEAELDVYLHAIGMEREAPLFRHVGLMSVDVAAREQVIEAFKLLVPENGEVIVKCGGQTVRLWRDEEGEARVADHFDEEAVEEAAAEAKKGKRTLQ